MANYFDKYKYVKYNDIYLSDICEIQDIQFPLLSSRMIDTLDIPSIDGEIFNGSKYNSYKIKITVLIDCDTQEEYNDKIKILKETFDVNEPKPFYINQDKFILAMTDDEIEPQEKQALYSREFIINLFCPNPYFYSNSIKGVESTYKNIKVVNEGNRPIFPIISVGFSTDAYFAQLELKETGQKILVGKYPTLGLTTMSHSTRVLYDKCETTSSWVDSSASIDADRTGGGTLAITNDGKGIRLNSPGSGETTWKGACVRQNLTSAVDEFKLSCNIYHNSIGTNGDPTVFYSDKSNTSSTIVSGSKTTFYQVTCSSLNVRTGPGTNYKKLGTLTKGYKIKNGTLSNGWVKFNYNNKDGYCSNKYLTKKVEDNTKKVTETTTEENMMAYNTTGKGYGTNLLESPKNGAKILCSIPTGTILRIISSKKYRHDYKIDGKSYYKEFYKLAKKYNGYSGYVSTSNLLKANEVTIEYDEIEGIETADDKTGIIEVYGFDINGGKIFSLGMYDDNKWYEYTYPKATIGNKTVLKDTTKIPEPQKKRTTTGSDGDKTVTISNRLSDKLGGWNEFWGTWTISRKKVKGAYIWDVQVQKIKDGNIIKTQKSINLKSNNFPTEKLSYIVLYIGTTGDMEKSSAMALTHIAIDEINPKTEEEKNVTYFKEGDILEIDCQTHTAYLNDEECNHLIDAGSRFFELPTGESNIKINSNDDSIVTSVIYREKYLGDS